MIIVCPLALLEETVRSSGARHVVTLLADGVPPTPAGIEQTNHLVIDVDDISEPLEDHLLPELHHIERLLDFARGWDRSTPMVIHCFAGISRSTAAAFAAACAHAPERDEAEIARMLRAASPSATPNRRIVALADLLLGREGRMIAAIEAIGRGLPAYAGEPFMLRIDDRPFG
jgi:predicted protein tyrosine phosphatase